MLERDPMEKEGDFYSILCEADHEQDYKKRHHVLPSQNLRSSVAEYRYVAKKKEVTFEFHPHLTSFDFCLEPGVRLGQPPVRASVAPSPSPPPPPPPPPPSPQTS